MLWTIASGVAVGVLVLALGPVSPLETVFPGADKVCHFGAALVITSMLLLAGVWRPRRGAGLFPTAAPFVVLGVIFGSELVEFAQRFLHRDDQAGDIVAGALGAILAYAIWWAVARRSDSTGIHVALIDRTTTTTHRDGDQDQRGSGRLT